MASILWSLLTCCGARHTVATFAFPHSVLLFVRARGFWTPRQVFSRTRHYSNALALALALLLSRGPRVVCCCFLESREGSHVRDVLAAAGVSCLEQRPSGASKRTPQRPAIAHGFLSGQLQLMHVLAVGCAVCSTSVPVLYVVQAFLCGRLQYTHSSAAGCGCSSRIPSQPAVL